MTTQQTKKISKFLSFVLRHQPDEIGLKPDSAGWVPVDDLLAGMQARGRGIDLEQLNYVVENNNKKRFEFSEDGERIRASQGHSIEVDLDYQSQEPPELLYHGSATRFLDSILADGLNRGKRHHVHLSSETKVTMEVGARHGKPVLLAIHAGKMHSAGFEFFLSTNGVWLVDSVPAEFLEVRNQ